MGWVDVVPQATNNICHSDPTKASATLAVYPHLSIHCWPAIPRSVNVPSTNGVNLFSGLMQ